MGKHRLRAFRIGEEISKLRLGPEDYWLIYADKGQLNITSQQGDYRVDPGRLVIIRLNKKNICFHAEPGFSAFVLRIDDTASAELVQRHLLLMYAHKADINIFLTGKQEKSIRAAQEYLGNTVLPIHEITERCGFNDLSNFGRTFKKETGCAPKEFRAAKGGKADLMK